MIPSIRLYAYLAIAILIAGWATYERHHLISEGAHNTEVADAAGVARQKAVDDKKLKDASDGYTAEMGRLQKLYGDKLGEPPRIVRYAIPPSPVPAKGPASGEPAPGGVVLCDDSVHKERDKAYEMLGWAGDSIVAACRELNTAVH